MTIREARTEEDFSASRDLCDGFRDWVRKRYGADAWKLDRYYAPDKWQAVLTSLPQVHAPPDGEILIARLDGSPVGCVMMQRIDDGVCEMKRMFVRAEAQGHRVGRKLGERIMAIAAERGYGSMRLDTGVNHTEALRLYEALRFRRRPPYYEAPADLADHLVFMEADLPAR